MKKIILNFFIVILCLIIFAVLYFLFSEKPTSYIIRKLFDGGVAVKPTNYEQILSQVILEEDITYLSLYKENQLDFIYEKDGKNLPIIIWIHGGGFVGGDKSDITEYLVQLAQKGYFCVNVNYERAPEARYPSAIEQISEVYNFILTKKDEYEMDTSKIIFAGDSAGAVMVSQYVNAQVNDEYSTLSEIKQIVPKNHIKGAVLACGPYDFASLSIGENSKYGFIMKFFLDKLGHAYFGNRNWKESKEVDVISTLNKVDENFPPTFITDSNTFSFEKQGKLMADNLEKLGVEVERSFFDLEDGEITHEYQFNMELPQSVITFEKLTAYLDKTTKE